METHALIKFPLIQLPRKSEALSVTAVIIVLSILGFPLIQLPRKSEEGDALNPAQQDKGFH